MVMRQPDEKAPRLMSYREARRRIRSGDLLLFRRRGIISIAGRGIHSHAAMAAWWDGDLFCLETRSFQAARAVLLSHLVERWPGRVDVFESNPGGRWAHYDRRATVRAMRRMAGLDYGWANLFWVGLMHAPVLRWFQSPDLRDDHAAKGPPFCSQAVVMATRAGGVDPVPRLADRLTEPADLARSPFYRYRFTLDGD